MKKLKYLTFAFPLLFGACAEELLVSDDGDFNTEISASMAEDDERETRTCVDPATYNDPKTLGILWTAGDSIGVFGERTRNALFRNRNAYTSKKTTFAGNMDGGEEPKYAYYPYMAENAGRDVRSLTGRVGDVQPFDMATGLITDDYKVGTPKPGTTDDFTFSHIFSLIKVDIDATGTEVEDEHLEYVRLDVAAPDGSPRPVAGRFLFDCTTGEYSGLTETSGSITMNWTDRPLLAKDARYAGFITAIPEIREGDTFTLTVATENKLASFTATSKKTFEAGQVYNFPMKLALYADEEHGWTAKPRAKFTSFGFTVAANAGKILDKRVENSGTNYSVEAVSEEQAAIEGSDVKLTIPYLYDFRLTPTFTVPEGTTVKVNGVVQESGKTEQDFSKPVKYEVITADDTHVYTVDIRNSGLPVVVIDQSASGDFSLEDGGNFILHKYRNQFLDFKIRKKSSDWVKDDKITIYNADGTVNLVQSNCGVRQRGNSTKKYPKKALAIKLDSKMPALGMPKSKRWVLLANWLDHSVIRNAAAFAVAHAIEEGVKASGLETGIPWNPHGQNVELVIDGRHVGNYLFAEQIKVEKTRLDIADSFEDRLADGKSTAFADCGYLMEFDQSYDEPWKFRTAKSNIPVQIKDDVIGGDATGKQHWTRIEEIINGIEANLLAGNYAEAYKNYDINSAIDQWFVYELTQNREYTEPRSVYYYIDRGGKLCAGPVWDFDRGTFHNPTKAAEMGNESNRIKPYNVWLSEFSTGNKGTVPGVWYRALLKDAAFRAAVKARWTAVRPYLEAVSGEIMRLAEQNRVSWDYNNRMWPTTKAVRKAGNDGNEFKDWSGDEWLGSYDEVIDNMLRCYAARLAGMDALIEAL